MIELVASERYTVRSNPPDTKRMQQRAYWPSVFAEARTLNGEWVRTVRTFGRSTARQIASDIRNAHRRSLEKFRLSGVESGEVWDARWGCVDAGSDESKYVLWIRLVSEGSSLSE